MYRKIEKNLLEWKQNKNKKSLLITGARQIGKTYIVRKFAKANYENFIEINFITTPEAIDIFNGNLDADSLVMNLTAFLRQSLTSGNTLIFFDEIQECPRARTALKFLVEDGRFDYICSGSLLGVNYKSIPSLPVGYESTIYMYPMDFEEFCIANSVQPEIFAYLKDCYEGKTVVRQIIHDTMLNLFKFYMIVGGMPDVVRTFVETNDIGKVVALQRDIASQYRQDIIKYAQKDPNKITKIFDEIPSQLDDKNRRFQLASLDKNARLRQYEEAFVWLQDTGVALPCFNLSEPKIPLKINEQSRLFKLYLNDTGLLCAMGTENTQFEILRGNLSVNFGSIMENVFAQQLKSNGFSLRYFNKRNVGEVDFVLQQNTEVVLVEIKSGNDYKQHAALNNTMKVKEWNLKKAIVFCQGNVEKDKDIVYMPWYMIMFLKQNKIIDAKINLDLSGLKI